MKSVVKADTKIAQGATKGTNPAAKGSEATTEFRKSEEEKIRNHREKVQRTPPPTKKDTSADKRCDFLTLMRAPGGLTLATALKRGDMTRSNPCSDDCEGHVTFDEVTYGLCEVHLNMIDACNQTSMNFEASERSDKTKEARTVEPANKAITTAELNGNFLWVEPWEEEMSPLGSWLGVDQTGWQRTWRKSTFTTEEVNAFGGDQVLNKRGATFQLSVFVASYSLDKEHAFVVIPLIHAQCKVTRDLLHNHEGRGWSTVPLMNSIRGLATYADGLSEDGESMFLDIPEPDLNARIAELEEGDDEKEEFQAHHATPTSSKAFVESATLAAKDVWKQHAEQIIGTAGKEGSLKSPGKLFAGKTIYQGELAALGKDSFKDCQIGLTPISPFIAASEKKGFKKFDMEKKNKFWSF